MEKVADFLLGPRKVEVSVATGGWDPKKVCRGDALPRPLGSFGFSHVWINCASRNNFVNLSMARCVSVRFG